MRPFPMFIAGSGLLMAAFAIAWPVGIAGLDPIDVDVVAAEDSQLVISWAGDTLLGDGSAPFIAKEGFAWPLENVASLLAPADVVIVNAEAPITDRTERFLPGKEYSYFTDPPAATALRAAGVNVLGLANNHAMDAGPNGLVDTIANADDVGMAVVGAGSTLAEAERPILLRTGDITVGIVALGKYYGSTVTAGIAQAGTVPLSPPAIRRGYQLAKQAGADFVVGFVHWGENYTVELTEDQRGNAAIFADAGYDLVIGHGPHVVQETAMVGDTPVIYSIGNFVFGAPGRFSDRTPRYGLVVTTTFGPDGLLEVSAACISVDNSDVEYQPTECDPEMAALANAAIAPVRPSD